MLTTITESIYHAHCCNCGLLFGIDNNFDDQLRQNHRIFYCPSGHPQSYTGENKDVKIARLENEKKLEQEKRVRAERDSQIFREEAFVANEKSRRLRVAIKKKTLRIKNGLCPHCDRSFENLHRHMVTKHSHCKSDKEYKVKKVKLP